MNKRKAIMITMLGLLPLVSSCSLYDLGPTFTSDNGSVEKYSSDNITSVDPLDNPISKTKIQQTYTDFYNNSIYAIDDAPKTGTIHPLVIPIWFTDSTRYVPSNKREEVRQDINKAYFGSKEQTGWNSVKTFYEQESEGRLTIDGITSSWYECGRSSTYYYTDDQDQTASLVVEAVDWYFANNKEHNRRYFDADSNGYLDAVMLIYACPDYTALNNENADNLWAYCYWVQNSNYRNATNPGPNTYFWASYDFMYGRPAALAVTGNTYFSGDTRYCSIDAHTYIHEMGHVFGLEDYYDYGDNSYVPAGGFSMQDCNVGAHDPFSVMAFGWADPFIPKTSCEISLRPFQVSHDLILLTSKWNEFDSVFDEYLLLEFYTPSGLNEFDSYHKYCTTYPSGPLYSGIRLWHVDARLLKVNESDRYGDPVFSNRNFTNDCYANCNYGVASAFNNSYNSDNFPAPLGSAYEKYDLLHLIRNNGSISYKTSKDFAYRDLFGDGATFSMRDLSRQFPNGAMFDNNSTLGWSFEVSISGAGSNSIAKITLTKE